MATTMFALVDTPYDEGRKLALGQTFFEASDAEKKEILEKGTAREATEAELKVRTAVEDVEENDREAVKIKRASSKNALQRAKEATTRERQIVREVDGDKVTEKEADAEAVPDDRATINPEPRRSGNVTDESQNAGAGITGSAKA